MTNRIDETLRKIAENTSKGNTPTSSNIDPRQGIGPAYEGDPNCPICHGVGFVRRDLPLGDPNFGKVEVCSCRAKEVAATAYRRIYQMSNLAAFKEMTFETFKVQGRLGMGEAQLTTLKTAFDVAQTYARTLSGWLLLTGSYGVGKTHLAASIANFAVEMGVPTLFLTTPDLLDWLRYAYGSADASFEERFEEIRNVQLLVMDDLGTQNATPWAQEKLYQILNWRYTNRLPTVVTTNQPLEEIEGRVQSRLRDPELVTTVKIVAPDYRQPTADTTQPRLSSLHLYGRMTFGSWSGREKLSAEERANLNRAFKLAQEFAEHPRGWLVFSGTYGCGKTHLAAAIGNYQASAGQPPLFVVVPDLLDHLRSTFSPNSSASYDEVFEEVRSARLLILDDLGTQSATPWAREKLYQIFNHRYTAELPTVITTTDSLGEIDPRIRTRMMDARLCTFFAILAPAYVAAGEAKRGKRG